MDAYGNVVIVQNDYEPAGNFLAFRKLNGDTGTVRWSDAYSGVFQSTLNLAAGVTVGPDNQPIFFANSPLPYNDPYYDNYTDAIVLKLADSNPPIGHPDYYSVVSGQSLSSSAASVLANDEDAVGARGCPESS